MKAHGAAGLSLSVAEQAEFVALREAAAAAGITVAEAVRLGIEQRQKGRQVRMLLSVAIRECLKAKDASNKRPRYLDQLGYNCRAFLASLGGDDPFVDAVTGTQVAGWLHGNGWKPATVRTKRIDLQTLFGWCQRQGWSESNPVAGIERECLDDKPPGILTVEQAARLMRACEEVDPGLLAYLALGLFAGIRPEEIVRLRPRDVRGEHVEVRADASKTRQRRLVDLAPNLRAWLSRCGALELPPRNWRGRMYQVRRAAGFASARRRMVGGRERWESLPGDPWPHDVLRHSFASYHLAMHGSADRTALQMGHRSTDMLFRHYRELVTKAEAEKFWGIRPQIEALKMP